MFASWARAQQKTRLVLGPNLPRLGSARLAPYNQLFTVFEHFTSDPIFLFRERNLLLLSNVQAVGLAGAFGVTRFIESQLFQVGTTDPVTFRGVAVTFLVIGTLASLVPAWSAARVDPVQSIHLD